MQNSLPSGSASTTHPVPSGLRRSSTSFAPKTSNRTNSSSRVPCAGFKSRCTRFLSCLALDTSMNSKRCVPSAEKIRHSTSPARFGASGSSWKSRTSPQNTDWANASMLSKVV
ncbi:MAG TPA: hypothetical protein DCY59_02565 [Micrococcaceae bacterium]|nr:hypothetical protein [Micrococcaceae bacterium]